MKRLRYLCAGLMLVIAFLTLTAESCATTEQLGDPPGGGEELVPPASLLEHKLPVPFESQWDRKLAPPYDSSYKQHGGKNGGANCGPASLTMVLNYYGKHVTFEQGVAAVRSNNLTGDTDFESSESKELLKRNGLDFVQVNAVVLNMGSVADIKAQIDQNRPVIMLVDNHYGETYGLYGGLPGMAVNAHIIVVTGYRANESGTPQTVFINDPLVITPALVVDGRENFGKDFALTAEEFTTAARSSRQGWYGAAVCQIDAPPRITISATPTPKPIPTPTTQTHSGSPVKYGQTVAGNIGKSGDHQDWKFSGVKGEVVTIRMLRDNNVTLSCYLQLLDGASGQELKNSYYGSGQAETRVQNYALPVTGAYIMRASGGSSTAGAYTLNLSVNAAPRKLSYGQQGNGTIPISKAYEDWTFNGVKGEVVTVRMLSDNNVTLSCYIHLLDAASGQELSNSYYGSGQAEARMQNYALPVTGDYIIRASGGSDTKGAYSLSLIVNATPRKLNYGQQGNGTIPISKAYEDWAFSGVKGEVVTIRMLRDNNVTLSCYMHVLDAASGQELGNSYYGSGQAEARVQNFTLPVTGAYLIRASGGSDTTGAYTLSLNKQ